MSATKLGLLATAAKTAIDAAAIVSLGNALKVYTYEPRDLDSLPALTIDGPTDFARSEPDEPESQLGSNDWRLTYLVRIYVPLGDPETASDESRAILGQVIAAIDADRTLGGEADLDASLADGSRELVADANEREMFLFTCSLRIWALVP